MLDQRKVSPLLLFLTFLIFGFATPSTTSAATVAADYSEASTTPALAAVVSRDQVTCTMCAACENPCQPIPSPPPPSPPPPEVECPPPPSPSPPPALPPPSPPPPEAECPPPPPMPPACGSCDSPGTGSTYASPPPPATSGGGVYPPPYGGYYPMQPPPNPMVPYFPYYYYNPPQASVASTSSLHLETNAAGFATSLVLSGLLYVLLLRF
ncbi:uncharacterized protein J3R85_010205 [Psidium guajava]|nr:uncharacterized protein J3R85_010205 [Psidium guajava]